MSCCTHGDDICYLLPGPGTAILLYDTELRLRSRSGARMDLVYRSIEVLDWCDESWSFSVVGGVQCVKILMLIWGAW